MKKQLFLAIFAILAFLNVNAQDNGDFEFGIHSGLNLANITVSEGQTDTNTRVAFNAGVSSEYYFSDRWGIKAKLIYDSKGWANGFIDDEENNSSTTTNI